MKYRIIAIPFILALLMAGFSGCGTKEAKPETEAEEAGEQQEETVYKESVVCDDEASQGEMAFTEVVQEDADGYRLQIIRHNSFAFTDLCKLYSPAGRMLLIASGCQECGSLGGYWIDYDSRGRVVKVCSTETCYDLEFLNEKGGEAVRQIRRLLNDSKRAESEVRYDIVRDSTGTVVRIGNVSVPFGYKGRFYVKEWGPFWESDLRGGQMRPISKDITKHYQIACSSMSYTLFAFYRLMFVMCLLFLFLRLFCYMCGTGPNGR